MGNGERKTGNGKQETEHGERQMSKDTKQKIVDGVSDRAKINALFSFHF